MRWREIVIISVGRIQPSRDGVPSLGRRGTVTEWLNVGRVHMLKATGPDVTHPDRDGSVHSIV